MTDCRTVVLISGSGTNLQALIDQQLNYKIVGVFSNKSDAYGLQRAHQGNIQTRVVEHKKYPDRSSYDQALATQIQTFEPDLVLLSGFMRILTAEFVHLFQGRLLNIHPSLLPKFKGLNTYERVLASGDEHHGSSVHFVIPELDAGPVIMQSRVAIQPEDNPTSLSGRVQALEHKLYPTVVRLFAAGRITLADSGVQLDGKPLEDPLLLDNWL